MGPRARMLAGILVMILGIALFFSSVMVIVRYGPLGIVMVFVGMFVMAGGAILLSRSGSAPVGPVASDMSAPMPEREAPLNMEPEVMTGIGSGYCANCGAPLSPGDTFCGVCGKRL